MESLILALVILVVVGLVVYRRRFRRSSLRARAGRGPASASASLGQVQKQLYRLVNGDRRTAQRLVETVRQRNPGQSERWYWEKAIYDIERDRRA